MGSKAKHLKQLLNAGFNVPGFITVPSQGITSEILNSLVSKSLNEIQLFAVRSSAEVEDSKTHSYAGFFHSEIGITSEGLFEAYLNVVDSFKGSKGSVIIQQFIPSDVAGVIFTNDGNGLMVINSCQGLCKTVVEGHACDEWYVSRNAKIMRKFISTVKKPLVFKNQLLFNDITSQESLTEAEISNLVSESIKIESFFGSPQDIEWCFYNQKLYILQSRPITRFNKHRDWIFYDSANIAESYSGIVLPLTYSFAVSIYKNVYENLLVASGASRKRINNNQQIFSQMIASFYGRMYYNMNNWYRMMSFIPGYKRNKTNLEDMLTMNIQVDVPRSVLPTFWLKITYPLIVMGKLLFFRRTTNRFIHEVKSRLHWYRNQDIENYSIGECYDAYQNLTKNLLSRFHIPVENDFLMMTYLGILKKNYKEDKLKELIAFENISSKQVFQISQMAQMFYAISDFAMAIDQGNAIEFCRLLNANPNVKAIFNNYFSIYGGRFANELKLESADIEHDIESFLSLIKAYKNYKTNIKKENQHQPSGFVISRFIRYARQRETFRLLRSNCFSLVRRIFKRMGVIFAQLDMIEHANDIFYLKVEEVMQSVNNINELNLKSIVAQRKAEYETYKTIHPPIFFNIPEGEQPLIDHLDIREAKLLYGRSCTPGKIIGRVRVFDEFCMPETIDFEILVTSHTDPGWTALIGLSKGLVVEHGGILSHAAIVSRELGIPTVIGIPNVTKILKTGQMIELNGSTGEIKII